MILIKWKKAATWVVLTLIGGALTNLFGDLGFKPAGAWLWRVLLSAITLGSKALKDQVYLEAAKGSHEAIASLTLAIVMLFFGLFTGAMLFMTGLAFRFSRIDRKDNSQSYGETIEALRKPLHWSLPWLLLLGLVASVGNTLPQIAMKTAASDAFIYYRQSYQICRPYMTDRQAQEIESGFSSIRSRDDYLVIVEQLKNIATSNGRKLPVYSPW